MTVLRKTYIADETTGDTARVNSDGQLHIVAEGMLCTSNSTTTPLAGGGVFTGTAVNIFAYNAVSIFITSDVASAVGGVEVQYSKDGLTGWRTAESYTLVAGAEKWYTPPAFGGYFRVVFTNGASAQTTFELTTNLRKVPIKWSSHNIEDPITDEDDATLTKAVITGKKASGDYDNVSLTNGGNMKVSIEELESGISEDTNTSLRVAPILEDEFAIAERMLSDNIFLGSPVVINSEHHEIHCGDSYEATDNVTLPNAGSRDYLIIVPNSGTVSGTNTGGDQSLKIWHFLELIESELEVIATLYEGADRVAGTAISSFNRDRNSTRTDTLNISHTPTGGTTDGSLIWGPWRIGSGRVSAGSRGRDSEFILKDNTKYILNITNNTTNNNNVNVEFDYYVHPGV